MIATHATFPLEALDLVSDRMAPTHDVMWEYDSYDTNGPCVATNSLQAYGLEMAEELAKYCRADAFKMNVRIVPRAQR